MSSSAAAKISPEHPFMNREVILNFTNEMSHTLSLMAGVQPSFGKPYIASNWKPTNEISVYLVVSTEQFKGQVQFHLDKIVAKNVIEKMVGSGIDPDSDEVLDGVGEISNIFYGSAKTKLSEIGFQLNSSLPKPCWTKNLPVHIGNTLCMVVPFELEGAQCAVEFIFYD